jgi:hypothetical protein
LTRVNCDPHKRGEATGEKEARREEPTEPCCR